MRRAHAVLTTRARWESPHVAKCTIQSALLTLCLWGCGLREHKAVFMCSCLSIVTATPFIIWPIIAIKQPTIINVHERSSVRRTDGPSKETDERCHNNNNNDNDNDNDKQRPEIAPTTKALACRLPLTHACKDSAICALAVYRDLSSVVEGQCRGSFSVERGHAASMLK
eukprot:862606-Amphidinium_carterae.1